jgi:hypothetical protein
MRPARLLTAWVRIDIDGFAADDEHVLIGLMPSGVVYRLVEMRLAESVAVTGEAKA